MNTMAAFNRFAALIANWFTIRPGRKNIALNNSKKDDEMEYVQVTPTKEWLADCNKHLFKAKQQAAKKIYDKYGAEVPFPYFLHLDLCSAIDNILRGSPNKQEAIRMIAQAQDEVFENHEWESS